MALTLPIEKLLDVASPVECPPWPNCHAMTPDDVMEYAGNRDGDQPVGALDWMNPEAHAKRIAYLMWHGWDDPIHLHVGYGDKWPIEDGNHRLYAASIRGDQEVTVVVTGELELAAELLELPLETLEEDWNNGDDDAAYCEA